MQSIATFLQRSYTFNGRICPICTLLQVTRQHPLLGANVYILPYNFKRKIAEIKSMSKKGFAYILSLEEAL